MYCKICGNLLSNEDTMCKACGSEVIMDTKPEINFQEQVAPEVIFNPPFDSLPKKENNEAEGKKEGRIGRPDTGEFSWNVYDFPKPQKTEPIKTETANFNWSSEEIEAAKEAQEEARAKAQAQAQFKAEILNEDLKQEFVEELGEDKFKTKNLSDLGLFNENSAERIPTDTIEIEKSLFVKEFENILFKNEEPKVEVKEELNLVDQLLKDSLPNEMESKIEDSIIHESLPNIPIIEMPAVDVAPQIETQSIVEDEEIITKSDLEKATYEQFVEKGIESSSDKEKFFTFSKKNEEFQRLLDKEYARINGVEEELPKAPTPISTISTPEPLFEPTAVPVYTPEILTAPIPIAEMKPVEIQENKGPKLKTIVTGDQTNAERPELSEMATARRNFFMDAAEEEIVLDNDTIKQKYDTLEVLRDDLKHEKKEEGQEPAAVMGAKSPASLVSDEGSKKGLQQGDYSYFDANQSEEDDEYEDQSKSGVFAKVVLVVIILLLIAELTILGIKYFMPDSQATAFIQNKEIIIVENVTAWINSIKNMFAK